MKVIDAQKREVLAECKSRLRGMDRTTNVYKTLEYILQHGSITSMEAFRSHNNTRLSATIKQLRDVYNIPIITVMVTAESGKRYGVYKIGGR